LDGSGETGRAGESISSMQSCRIHTSPRIELNVIHKHNVGKRPKCIQSYNTLNTIFHPCNKPFKSSLTPELTYSPTPLVPVGLIHSHVVDEKVRRQILTHTTRNGTSALWLHTVETIARTPRRTGGREAPRGGNRRVQQEVPTVGRTCR